MGDCNETLKELERFLDGDLNGSTLHAIQSHLDGCLDCLSAYDFHAELRMVIQRKCHSDEMPPTLLERIEQCFGLDDIEGGAQPA